MCARNAGDVGNQGHCQIRMVNDEADEHLDDCFGEGLCFRSGDGGKVILPLGVKEAIRDHFNQSRVLLGIGGEDCLQNQVTQVVLKILNEEFLDLLPLSTVRAEESGTQVRNTLLEILGIVAAAFELLLHKLTEYGIQKSALTGGVVRLFIEADPPIAQRQLKFPHGEIVYRIGLIRPAQKRQTGKHCFLIGGVIGCGFFGGEEFIHAIASEPHIGRRNLRYQIGGVDNVEDVVVGGRMRRLAFQRTRGALEAIGIDIIPLQ